MSLRLPDELAAQVRAHAEGAGRSLNGWITAVLAAAVDPDLAGSEAEPTRERLARAGQHAQRRAPVSPACVR
jgi:hypothetical protein